MRAGDHGAQKQRQQGEEREHDPSQGHDGHAEPPRGPASPEKMLTEGALGDHRRHHLDNGGGRPPCRVGGLRRGALPSNISWALEDTEAANL
jgi:hypothetical protein